MDDELKTRIAATSATLRRLNEVVRGLGVSSNNEAINILIDLAILHTGKKDELLAGYELRSLLPKAKDSSAEGNKKAHQGLPDGRTLANTVAANR